MCLIECADVEPAAMKTQLFLDVKRTVIWQSEINSLSGHLFWQQFEGRISCSEAGKVEGQLEGSRGHLRKGLGSGPRPWEWKGSHGENRADTMEAELTENWTGSQGSGVGEM